MSEWEFLWGLEEELMDVITSGETYDDWGYIEEMEKELLY